MIKSRRILSGRSLKIGLPGNFNSKYLPFIRRGKPPLAELNKMSNLEKHKLIKDLVIQEKVEKVERLKRKENVKLSGKIRKKKRKWKKKRN